MAVVGGMVYPITGDTVLLDEYMDVARDFYRQREGVVSSLKQLDGTFKTTFTLKDYSHRLRHVIDANGTCITTKMAPQEVLPAPCIPANASFVGDSVLGGSGAGGNLHVHTTVTRDQCTPVAETFNTKVNGVATQATYFF